ncbi:hypothetical protein NLP62_24615, partial [Escherichia coli]|nr:hypothetical protein [Escherichia coli]
MECRPRPVPRGLPGAAGALGVCGLPGGVNRADRPSFAVAGTGDPRRGDATRQRALSLRPIIRKRGIDKGPQLRQVGPGIGRRGLH